MSTVVPGPKKSPSAPAGARRSRKLRIGLVTGQDALTQMCALSSSPAGRSNAERSGMKLFPGLVRFRRLNNSTKGLMVTRSRPPKVSAHSQIDLGIRSATKLIERCLLSVDHSAIVRAELIPETTNRFFRKDAGVLTTFIKKDGQVTQVVHRHTSGRESIGK